MAVFGILRLQRLREEAGRRGTAIFALVEAGLRRLRTPGATASEPNELPPLPTWDGGDHLVDIDDRDALYRAMEEDG